MFQVQGQTDAKQKASGTLKTMPHIVIGTWASEPGRPEFESVTLRQLLIASELHVPHS